MCVTHTKTNTRRTVLDNDIVHSYHHPQVLHSPLVCVCVCVCVNDGLKAFSGVVSAAVPFVLRRKLLIHTSHSTQSP